MPRAKTRKHRAAAAAAGAAAPTAPPTQNVTVEDDPDVKDNKVEAKTYPSLTHLPGIPLIIETANNVEQTKFFDEVAYMACLDARKLVRDASSATGDVDFDLDMPNSVQNMICVTAHSKHVVSHASGGVSVKADILKNWKTVLTVMLTLAQFKVVGISHPGGGGGAQSQQDVKDYADRLKVITDRRAALAAAARKAAAAAAAAAMRDDDDATS